MAGATKLFVEDGTPVGNAEVIEEKVLREDELDVEDGRSIRGVGVVVAVFDVNTALGIGSASSSHGSQSRSLSST